MMFKFSSTGKYLKSAWFANNIVGRETDSMWDIVEFEPALGLVTITKMWPPMF